MHPSLQHFLLLIILLLVFTIYIHDAVAHPNPHLLALQRTFQVEIQTPIYSIRETSTNNNNNYNNNNNNKADNNPHHPPTEETITPRTPRPMPDTSYEYYHGGLFVRDASKSGRGGVLRKRSADARPENARWSGRQSRWHHVAKAAAAGQENGD